MVRINILFIDNVIKIRNENLFLGHFLSASVRTIHNLLVLEVLVLAEEQRVVVHELLLHLLAAAQGAKDQAIVAKKCQVILQVLVCHRELIGNKIFQIKYFNIQVIRILLLTNIINKS